MLSTVFEQIMQLSLLEIILLALLIAIVALVFYRLIFGRPDDAAKRAKGPFNASGWTLLVDGSNFAHRDISNRPTDVRLRHLEEVLDTLAHHFKHADIQVFCDANLRHKLNKNDRRKFISRVKRRRANFHETHGKSADEVLLKYAQTHKNCLIVSNDKFDKEDEPEQRLGVPLLKVSLSKAGVRLPSRADLFRHADRPFKNSRPALRNIFERI